VDAAPGADQLPPPLVIELVPEPGAPVAGRRVVIAGESFWTIAEQVVTERALPVPVASYWRLLVEANRDRLVDRTDPNLIHPGQELVLP
jgi:nucleoid-associated protein YgaU